MKIGAESERISRVGAPAGHASHHSSSTSSLAPSFPTYCNNWRKISCEKITVAPALRTFLPLQASVVSHVSTTVHLRKQTSAS